MNQDNTMVQPGPSGYNPPNKMPRLRNDENEHDKDPEKQADEFIRDTEKAKARVFEVPGKHNSHSHPYSNQANFNQGFMHSMYVDEQYCAVASHVDIAIKNKIIEGQYVNFSKLLVKDRVLTEDDNRVQLIMKGGSTYFVPASDNSNGINSLVKWDQAFRVFSDIYCKAHPQRSTELIQYCHVIHTAASGYVWDNVYAYDRDFRLHMGENPGQSWSIILQQSLGNETTRPDQT